MDTWNATAMPDGEGRSKLLTAPVGKPKKTLRNNIGLPTCFCWELTNGTSRTVSNGGPWDGLRRTP